MRKSIKSLALLSFIVIGLIAMGASFTTAYPSLTTECGNSGCHDTHTLTISSNATGPVNATVGQSFKLEIDASGYSGGDQLFYVAIEPTWADNNQFTFTTVSVQDNGAGDLDATLNQISISVDFTPISAGTHTIRIWTAGKNDLAGSLDIVVDAAYDANAPIIDNPADIEYEYQDTGYQITWNATDPNPVNYTIYRNGTIVGSGGWNGSIISIVVDWLIPGAYEYTLTVFNIGGYSASDSVIVTVSLPTPTTTITTTTITTTTTTTTTDTTTTSEPSETTTTTQVVPTGSLIHPAVVGPLALVVGTWVGIIIVVILISEILLRKGKW